MTEAWPYLVFDALDRLRLCAAALCVVLAAIAAVRPRTFSGAAAYLDRLESRPIGRWSPAALLAVVVPYAVFYAAEYRAFLIPRDSAGVVNQLWNLVHGYGMRQGLVADMPALAVHFQLSHAVLAPLLWLWPHPLALIFGQAVVVCSSALGVYLLARRFLVPAWAAWLLAILTLAHPFFRALMGEVFDPTMLALPFFIWAAYAWETGRLGAALILAALLLATKEEAPFIGAGFGALMLVSAKEPGRRWAGAAVIAGSVLAWAAEVAVIAHFRRLAIHLPSENFDNWHLYSALGASRGEVLRTTLLRPWRAALALVYPFVKLWTVARALLFLSLLPLAAGPSLLPALAVWLPHQLADPGAFQRLETHYSAFVFGPLLWASARGLARALRRPGSARPVAACLLAACAAGFFASDSFIPPKDASKGLRGWLSTAPPALASVPPDANVLCDEFLTSHLAMRRHVRSLPYANLDPYALGETFVPDRIVVSSRWLFLTQHLDMRVLAPLIEAGFGPIFANSHFTVLGKPPPDSDAQAHAPKPSHRVTDSMDTDALLFLIVHRMALEGNEQAQFNLGVMYSAGQGVAQDRDHAVWWWLKAAQRGWTEAKNSLGSEYTNRGNWPEGVKWFLEAAMAGNAEAQYNLGVAYTVGRGVAQDVPVAVGWFRKSAEQNYPPAQYNLGVCLADADPPIRDKAQAQRWLAKAAENGYKNAEKKLAEVRQQDAAQTHAP